MKQKKTTTAAKAPKQNKKLSLNEFRAWLSGVEEMQSDDWTPDPTQWRRIREKIEDIIDNPRRSAPDQYSEPQYGYSGGYTPAPIMPAAPSGFVPGAVPGPAMPMSPSTPLFASPKTPDIDTSKGGYASSLE
jgi:hypothetical protein